MKNFIKAAKQENADVSVGASTTPRRGAFAPHTLRLAHSSAIFLPVWIRCCRARLAATWTAGVPRCLHYIRPPQRKPSRRRLPAAITYCGDVVAANACGGWRIMNGSDGGDEMPALMRADRNGGDGGSDALAGIYNRWHASVSAQRRSMRRCALLCGA